MAGNMDANRGDFGRVENGRPANQSGQAWDMLGDVLSTLKVMAADIVYFEFSDPWTIKVTQESPLVCTIVDGCLWLKEAGGPPERFGPGDTFVMPRGASGRDFFVSSSATMSDDYITTDRIWEMGLFLPADPTAENNPLRRVRFGGSGPLTMRALSFTFQWRDKRYGPLVADLPLLMRQKSSATGSNLLRFFTDLNADEVAPANPGFQLLATYAAQLFLMHVVRSFAMDTTDTSTGWLRGFTDRQIHRALVSIHQAPGHRWCVSELAKHAGMSRSVFALRFMEVMGVSPMEYLRSWRMHLARLELTEGKKSILSLSRDLGYESEAGFRTAFRKDCGCSPLEYVKQTLRDQERREAILRTI